MLSDGKVGIGTTAPDSELHIQGTSNDVGMYVTKTSAGTCRFAYDTTGPYILDQNSKPFRIYTGNVERLRILANGRHMFKGMDSTSTYSSLALGHTSEAASGGYMNSWTNVFAQRLHIRTNGNANPSQHGTTTLTGSGKHNFRIMQNIGYNGVYWNSVPKRE